jgi:hypothetical protein
MLITVKKVEGKRKEKDIRSIRRKFVCAKDFRPNSNYGNINKPFLCHQDTSVVLFHFHFYFICIRDEGKQS